LTLGFAAGSGQACVAGSRIFVQKAVREEFTERLTQAIGTYTNGLGDPFAQGTRMGPLAFRAHYEKVRGYVDQAQEIGARLLTGSEPIAGGGLFVAPTLIDNIDNDSTIAQEEIFGPVAVLMPFDDLDDVVRLANDSIYGLAASVWTTDLTTAHQAADRIDVGTIWINRPSQQSAGPLPFGGFR
jgi:acyl-CoA reductase-like NAD-dependent aldehyde dehydrogenase